MVETLLSLLRPIPFRGKYRLLSPFFPRAGERACRLFGSTIRLNLASEMQRLIYLGAFEMAEVGLVRRCLRAGGTFVDAGANLGFFTFLAASIVGPSGRALAVEPNPRMFERLSESIHANRLAQVSATQIGLSDTAGSTDLYLPPRETPCDNATMLAGAAGSERVRVSVRPLDDVLAESGIESVDLLKIDVEGYEPRVLEGARKTISSGRIRAVLIELNDIALREAGSSSQQLFDHIVSLGYRDELRRPLRGDTWLENRLFILQD
jgi:FkbM family methyltransferase